MLETIDLSKSLSRPQYVRDLTHYQLQLRAMAYQLYVHKRSMVIVFEGWDAGGKGGAIKRITEKLDPRGYEVYPIAAPQGEDKTHHYLWRFWRRFQERQETPYKAWKLTEEDWRNRAKWDLYAEAINDMLLRTSTLTAPWTIVEGNDKYWARVQCLKTLVDALQHELKLAPPEPLATAAKGKKAKNSKANGKG